MAQVLYSTYNQIGIIDMKMQLIDEKESKQMDINQIHFGKPCLCQ